MKSPEEPNGESLEQLGRVLKLAEKAGLYLDIIGLGCYDKKEVPGWYNNLGEAQRWGDREEQAGRREQNN